VKTTFLSIYSANSLGAAVRLRDRRGHLYIVLGSCLAISFGVIACLEFYSSKPNDASRMSVAAILGFASMVSAGIAILGGKAAKPMQTDWRTELSFPAGRSEERSAKLKSAYREISDELHILFPEIQGYRYAVRELPVRVSWFSNEIRIRRRSNWGLRILIQVSDRDAEILSLCVKRESDATTLWTETSRCRFVAIVLAVLLVLISSASGGVLAAAGSALVATIFLASIADLSPTLLGPSPESTEELTKILCDCAYAALNRTRSNRF